MAQNIISEKASKARLRSRSGMILPSQKNSVTDLFFNVEGQRGDKPGTGLFSNIEGQRGATGDKPGTRYVETLMNFLKGNIGTGIFALAHGMKQAGLAIGCPSLLFLGVLNLHCQHMVVHAAKEVAITHNHQVKPDYAETLMVCFMDGPERFRNMAFGMKKLCNTLLVITQMGFASVIVIFLAGNLGKILSNYGYHIDLRLLIIYSFLPLWAITLINNLKFLSYLSMVAIFFYLIGIASLMYYLFRNIPHVSGLDMVGKWDHIPLYFGTIIYTFEAVGLVLPLYNEMNKPNQFDHFFGVMNVGTVIILSVYVTLGVFGYVKFGNKVRGSITLNLPFKEILAQLVVLAISLGASLGFPLMLYVPTAIMYSAIYKKCGPFRFNWLFEALFRTLLVIIVYIFAIGLPFLELVISLIGSAAGGMLALIFPPLMDWLTFYETISKIRIAKNILILVFGFCGIILGTYCSTYAIVEEFITQNSSNFKE